MAGGQSHRSSGGRRALWISMAIAAAVVAAAAPAQAAPFAYVSDSAFGDGPGMVSQYNVGAGGLLAPLSPPTVATGRFPRGVAVGPDARSVYVTISREDNVAQFDVGPGGRLSPKSPPIVGAGEFPSGIGVSPDGKNAYVTTTTGAPPFPSVVAQYDVRAGGRLFPKSPAMVPVGARGDVAVAPDSRSVYVGAGDRIAQFDVGAGGRLSPKSPPTVAAGGGAGGLAVSPDGRSLYVANPGANTVSQYNVGAGGRLFPKSPLTVAAGETPSAVVVSRSGLHVYVTNTGFDTSTQQGTVSQYSVGQGGRLVPKAPAQVNAGKLTVAVAMSPDGRNVYAANEEACCGSGTVSQYTVGGGGRLSPKSPPKVAAGFGPADIAITPPTPGWEGRVTNPASGCSARVQVPYLDGSLRVTAYTEVFCPRPTRLTIRSRLRSDYPGFNDVTVARNGCLGGSGCVIDMPKGLRYFRLVCPKSATRRQNQPYYTDITFYPSTNTSAATRTRSGSRSLSPFCAY